MIKAILITAAIALANTASAACYADYKAKSEPPLKLHYGVIEISDSLCGDTSAASQEVAGRIATDGWQLLNLMSLFGPEGLDQRKDSAGQYFLRY
jgi:hypothetical protein